MTQRSLTAAQKDAMRMLGNYVGQTVDVLLGEPIRSMNQDFVRRAKVRTTGPTLRGLHAKGFVQIEDTFWRGATVTVLRAMTEAEDD
jgi:hypothetical protein